MPTLKLSSSFQKAQFYETVKKLVNSHTIAVFQREKQDIAGCASRNEFESSACLLYSKASWAFSDRAIELIAQSMPEPCSARRLLYLLNEKGVLTCRRINRDSYQNRLRVYFRDGEYVDAELYSSNDSHAVSGRTSAALRLTVNQKGMIDQAYEKYLQAKMPAGTGNEAHDTNCSVNDFIKTLIADRTSFSGITPSVQRKLNCLADLSSSTDNVLDWSKYDCKVLVLDFRGSNGNPDWYKCYAELYLEDLFLYKQRCAQENDSPTPMIIVSDEFQNMNTMKGAALDKILREGRKYGISLWLASQLVESDSTSRLKYITDQSSMKVYFQAGTERSRKIANLLGKTPSERARLLSVIRSLEQREFVFQLNGKTPYKCIANEVKK